MQYLVGFTLLIALVVFILYKVNNQFEKKEFTILLIIISVTVLIYNLYEDKQDNFYPNLFKEHYTNTHQTEIEKLSYKLLNNQQISAKDKFIYNFTYIIRKEKQTYLCEAKNVTISKIEDSYVFEKYEEDCIEK